MNYCIEGNYGAKIDNEPDNVKARFKDAKGLLVQRLNMAGIFISYKINGYISSKETLKFREQGSRERHE